MEMTEREQIIANNRTAGATALRELATAIESGTINGIHFEWNEWGGNPVCFTTAPSKGPPVPRIELHVTDCDTAREAGK